VLFILLLASILDSLLARLLATPLPL
jgi:hypothetical protein